MILRWGVQGSVPSHSFPISLRTELTHRKVLPCRTLLSHPSKSLAPNAVTILMAVGIVVACSPPTAKEVCARTISAGCRPNAPGTTKRWPSSWVPSRTSPLPPTSIFFLGNLLKLMARKSEPTRQAKPEEGSLPHDFSTSLLRFRVEEFFKQQPRQPLRVVAQNTVLLDQIIEDHLAPEVLQRS